LADILAPTSWRSAKIYTDHVRPEKAFNAVDFF